MQQPHKPDDSDCCNSGCSPCIFDVYEQQLKLYEQCLQSKCSELHKSFINCLSLTGYSFFKLIHIEKLNYDTSMYIFEFVNTDNRKYKLFFKSGQHFLLKNVNIITCDDDYVQEEIFENEIFTRAYTPILFDDDDNKFNNLTSFRVLIKIYQNGRMSKFIKNLKLGSITKWRGPYGDFQIKFTYKSMLCVAQGTGIAPIYSVVKQLLDNEECETRINLYACFKNFDECLLRKEIHSMRSYWNFNATLFLPYEDELQTKLLYNENVECRRFNEQDFHDYFSQIDQNHTQILVCGNQKFVDSVTKFVEKYDRINLFIF